MPLLSVHRRSEVFGGDLRFVPQVVRRHNRFASERKKSREIDAPTCYLLIALPSAILSSIIFPSDIILPSVIFPSPIMLPPCI